VIIVSLQGKPLGPHPSERLWDPDAFETARGGKAGFSTVTVEGERVRVFSAPARRDGVQDGVIQVAHPLGELQRLVDSQLRTLFVLIPLALGVAGLSGLFLTSHALRPVRRITQAAAQIGAEDLSQRLEVTGKDELAELATTFNGMIGRLEGAFAGLSQAYRRLEASYKEQQRFTADASHELRTPLTRIKGMTSLALSGPHCADEYREALVVADQAADAMGRIVQDLLLLARADAGQLTLRFAPTRVEEALEHAAARLEGHPGAPIRCEPLTQPLPVNGDLDHLTRLVVNLLENAVRHTPSHGEVRMTARREAADVVIRISDTGEGIPPEHLPHVCERFYRVDASRTRADGGTGLGLAICQSIVQAHGGTLTLHSTPGQGTTVEVRLPAAGTTAPLALPAPAMA
jgi:signal transduction histidine kinase